MKKILCTCAAVLVMGALMAAPALATNGMNMIGYNARASGMGGADVAIDSDCSGTACNPATLGRSKPRSAAIGLSLLMPDLSQSDMFNPDGVDGESQVFPLPYIAYATRLGETSPWTIGFDLFAQGGMGVDFQNYNTFAGTQDKFESEVRYGRLTGAAAYRVNDQFSLGFGLMLGYADVKFSLFPNTYSPGMDGTPGTMDDFAGIDAEGMSSFGVAGRIGAHYKVNEKVSLGIQYTSEASLDLDGGDMTLNFGQAKANYDAEMTDFTWPQELEFGVAVQATPQLLIASDVKWIGWSSAIDVVTVKGSNPDIPVPLTNPELVFNMNWDDQWVFAIGAEYAINTQNAIRLGYNYGKSPIPDINLSPLFPAIVEHHATIGYGFTGKKWAFDAAWEHAFENEQTNNAMPGDPDAIANPFGPGVTVKHSQNTLHFAVTYFY
jgi:long-chain fatty acid transport protein